MSSSACKKMLEEYMNDVKASGQNLISFDDNEPEELFRNDHMSLWARRTAVDDLEIDVLQDHVTQMLEWLAGQGNGMEYRHMGVEFVFRSRQ